MKIETDAKIGIFVLSGCVQNMTQVRKQKSLL